MEQIYGKKYDGISGLIEGSDIIPGRESRVQIRDANYFYGVDVIDGKHWPWMRRRDSAYVKCESNPLPKLSEENCWQ